MDMARETHHRPSEEKLRHHQFMDVRTLTLMKVWLMSGAPLVLSWALRVVDTIRARRRVRKGIFPPETIEASHRGVKVRVNIAWLA